MKKYLLMIAVISFASCSDFLDIRPHDKIVPQSPEDYATLLNNMINEIETGSNFHIVDNVSHLFTNEKIMDDLDITLTTSAYEGWYYLGSYINMRSGNYEQTYTRIMQCNMILDAIGNVDTEYARKVVAATYAIRAVCHFNILRQFCEPVENGVYPDMGIVYVDHFDIEAKTPRSSYANSVRYIEEDFTRSLNLELTDRNYMFTEDVVNAFMARFYFWTQQWGKALGKAQGLLDKYPLASGEEYVNMFKSLKPAAEVIFKSKHFSDHASDVSETANFAGLQKRPVNKALIDLYDHPDKDIRYKLMMNSKRIVQKMPFPAIRSAEMALIAAECHYHLDDMPKALAMVNNLRRHRIADYTDMTMDDLPPVDVSSIIRVDAKGNALTPLMAMIHGERRKELFMEGDRLFERKRNGRPETWVPYNGHAYTNRKFMYTFPLPYLDVVLVDGVEQNEGYDVIRKK